MKRKIITVIKIEIYGKSKNDLNVNERCWEVENKLLNSGYGLNSMRTNVVRTFGADWLLMTST